MLYCTSCDRSWRVSGEKWFRFCCLSQCIKIFSISAEFIFIFTFLVFYRQQVSNAGMHLLLGVLSGILLCIDGVRTMIFDIWYYWQCTEKRKNFTSPYLSVKHPAGGLLYTMGYCYCWRCGVYDISDSVQEGWNVKNFSPPYLSITQLLEFFLTVWKSYCLCLVTSAILPSFSPTPPPPHIIIYIGGIAICIFLTL